MPAAFAGPRLLAGRGRRMPMLALLVTGATLLSACGSSTTSSAAVKSGCEQVNAVLSDGPDPGSDPVGYAEAQVQPLRQMHTQDKDLQNAVDKLSSAYEEFYSTNGGGSSKQEVSQATHIVDNLCSGVAS